MRQKGNLEVEIRFKVADAKKLRAALRNLGSKCLERWRGRDILFDKNNKLIPIGKLLRLRLGMERSGRGKLTFKGPYRDHVFKVREEFETIVENPAMAVKILAGLGYEPVVEYEKRTELWKYGGTEIYIEKLPRIGYFMEIEGSEKNIKKVAKILGHDIFSKENIIGSLGRRNKKNFSSSPSLPIIKEGPTKKSYREYLGGIDKKKKEWFFE